MNIVNKILIGNQTAFSAECPTLPFEYAINNNFNTFEWFPDKKQSGIGWRESDIDATDRLIIKQKAVQNKIRLTVHAPWWVNTIEDGSDSHINECINFAHDIGAELLNIHLYMGKGAEHFIDTLIPYLELLSNYGLKLSIENTPETSPADFNKVFSIIKNKKEINHDSVGMCFDIGHANLYKHKHNDYLGYFDQIDNKIPIIHIHLHENYGDYDSHLTFFTGPSSNNEDGINGFIERLLKRDFAGSIVMEQWPNDPSILNNTRSKLYDILQKKENDISNSLFLTNSCQPDTVSLVHESSDDTVPFHVSCNTATSLAHNGSGDFVNTIINGDKSAISWRNKLSFVYELFLDDYISQDNEKLIYLSLYLRFIHTGKIACNEDGSHYRSQNHANIAQELYKQLVEITNAGNAFIIRKIYPFIPSFDNAYTCNEPLTRIREIAHRNDIPKELKQEIKHTLQNKLHRCADPRDLITSELLLKRITSPNANVPDEFVKEFAIFHEELQEFFNAKPVEKFLESFISYEDVLDSSPIKEFLDLKRVEKSIPQQYIKLLDYLTSLRKNFINKSFNDTDPIAQKLKLAEIRLEEYAYVIVSEFINKFCSEKDDLSLGLLIQTLQYVIINLNLSDVKPKECSAIESELNAWFKELELDNHDHLLRLKSTLDRCKRLANEFTNYLFDKFSDKINKLGMAVGLAKDFIDTFCESEIRNSLVFQFSKLTSVSLKSIRKIANLSPWDIVVSGETTGRVVFIDKIDDLTKSYQEPVILAIESINGDEEIPTGVVGVVLGHQLPHLCHFGVRVQQAKIVFVIADDKDSFSDFKDLSGNVLSIIATQNTFKWSSISVPPEINNVQIDSKQISIPNTDLIHSLDILTFDKVTLTNSGNKAYTVKRLKELSKLNNANFVVPSGFVLPFGIMEASINSFRLLKAEYWNLVKRLENVLPADVKRVTKQIQHLITNVKIDMELIRKVIENVMSFKRVMVRSSSNCEDNDTLSGAGLYKSIFNVLPSNVEKAILEVWASLWSEQAVINRKKYGIPQNKAHMAILIQEMIVPEFSFIIHTINPVNNNANEIYVEIVVGLGEVLTSGAISGTPYRMICSKESKNIRIETFSNFSKALFPDLNEKGSLYYEIQDYSKVCLSVSEESREKLASRLSLIGQFVEDIFSKPQDIEGIIANNDIYLVQSRSQQVCK